MPRPLRHEHVHVARPAFATRTGAPRLRRPHHAHLQEHSLYCASRLGAARVPFGPRMRAVVLAPAAAGIVGDPDAPAAVRPARCLHGLGDDSLCDHDARRGPPCGKNLPPLPAPARGWREFRSVPACLPHPPGRSQARLLSADAQGARLMRACSRTTTPPVRPALPRKVCGRVDLQLRQARHGSALRCTNRTAQRREIGLWAVRRNAGTADKQGIASGRACTDRAATRAGCARGAGGLRVQAARNAHPPAASRRRLPRAAAQRIPPEATPASRRRPPPASRRRLPPGRPTPVRIFT